MTEFKTVLGEYWNPGVDESIEGILLKKNPATTEPKMGACYELELLDHTNIKVWGSKMLDDDMEKVKIGDHIQITFKGKKDIGKGKELNIYKLGVAIDEAAEVADKPAEESTETTKESEDKAEDKPTETKEESAEEETVIDVE